MSPNSLTTTDTDAGVECPVCGAQIERFEPHPLNKRPGAMCPVCDSADRHRVIWVYFQRHTDLFTAPHRLLHMAPEAALGKRLSELENIEYVSADISSPRAMVHTDICSMPFPDGDFDVVLASHVLEHIDDDAAAMRELYRVLRPGGSALLQIPIFGPKTVEDPAIHSPEDRLRHYGQADHVRLYGHDGTFERRLEDAGFEVESTRIALELDPEFVRRHGLTDDLPIYRAWRRP